MEVNVSTVKAGVAKDVSRAESETRTERTSSIKPILPSTTTAPVDETYTCEKDGVRYAGTHLLLDFRGGQNLQNLEAVETALRQSVAACGATLLDLRLHHFSPTGGVTGVAVLAESHMSIHTWPEFEYAAVDIFMCGDCDPYRAIPVLQRLFAPATLQICEQKRGYLG